MFILGHGFNEVIGTDQTLSTLHYYSYKRQRFVMFARIRNSGQMKAEVKQVKGHDEVIVP